MMQTFKILKGIDRLDPGEFFSLADKSLTRGHSLKIVKQRSRLTPAEHVQPEGDKCLECAPSPRN